MVVQGRRAAILFDIPGADPGPAEADVLVQAAAVASALPELGYSCGQVAAGPEVAAWRRVLLEPRPAVVFNLCESLGGAGGLIHVVPAVLEQDGHCFTGAPAVAMMLSTHKPTAKRWLGAHGLLTPAAWHLGELPPPGEESLRWIVKSASEDASLGLGDDSVVTGFAAAHARIAQARECFGGEWFAELFVEGREVSVSLLAGPGDVQVLPPAEIEFRGFPPGKPRLVGYRAKWDPASFEYQNTPRVFLDCRAEAGLCRELADAARRCWAIFGLRGYARVDFRIDSAGKLWVLEVNANPCLSPDAGFAAALERAGIGFTDAIGRIVADALRAVEGSR